MIKLRDVSNIVQHLNKAYKELVIKKNFSYKWKGPLLKRTSGILASAPNIDVQLNKANLNYAKEEQGRDTIEEIFTCAIQLGIQQGIDMAHNNNENMINSIKKDIKVIEMLLKSTCLKEPGKTKSVTNRLDLMKTQLSIYDKRFKKK